MRCSEVGLEFDPKLAVRRFLINSIINYSIQQSDQRRSASKGIEREGGKKARLMEGKTIVQGFVFRRCQHSATIRTSSCSTS